MHKHKTHANCGNTFEWNYMKRNGLGVAHNIPHTVSFVLKVSRIFITKCAFIVPSCNVYTFAIRYI